MNILLIDNYDSFTYNLRHMLLSNNCKVDVAKNDVLEKVDITDYAKVLISPGPGIPDEAGSLKNFIDTHKKQIDMLGVCLGMQAIVEVFGGRIKNLDNVYHGVSTYIEVLAKDKLFAEIPTVFKAGRYHSWAMDADIVPPNIQVIAKDTSQEAMGIKIAGHSVRGIQFHPESILTEKGDKIIQNWLSI